MSDIYKTTLTFTILAESEEDASRQIQEQVTRMATTAKISHAYWEHPVPVRIGIVEVGRG